MVFWMYFTTDMAFPCKHTGGQLEPLPSGVILSVSLFRMDIQKAKMAALYLQQPLPLHFAQFIGKSAAVYAQIICQLLAVERNIKFPTALLQRLIGKIGQQPPPNGLGTGMEDPAGKVQILL